MPWCSYHWVRQDLRVAPVVILICWAAPMSSSRPLEDKGGAGVGSRLVSVEEKFQHADVITQSQKFAQVSSISSLVNISRLISNPLTHAMNATMGTTTATNVDRCSQWLIASPPPSVSISTSSAAVSSTVRTPTHLKTNARLTVPSASTPTLLHRFQQA